jgi:hypothetical protein
MTHHVRRGGHPNFHHRSHPHGARSAQQNRNQRVQSARRRSMPAQGQGNPNPTNPSGGQLRVNVQPVPAQLRLNVQRVSSTSQVTFLNEYSGGKGRYLQLDRQQGNLLQETYDELKNAIAPPGSTEFVVYVSHNEVSYKLNGHNVVKDLQPILAANPALAQKMEEAKDLIQKDLWQGPLYSSSFKARNRMHSNGIAPFMRTNDALHALPKNSGEEAYQFALDMFWAAEPDPAKRTAALKRVAGCEKLIKHILHEIEQQINALNTQINANPPPANVAQLRSDALRLQQKQAALTRLDYAALYSALAFYPAQQPAQVAAQAEVLSQAMEQEVQKHSQAVLKASRPVPDVIPVISDWFRKEVNLEPNKNYPLDVGALMFAGLQDSMDYGHQYGDYCDRHGIYVKDQALEHGIYRAMVLPAAQNELLESLFQDLTDRTIATHLDQQVTTGKTNAQAIVTHAHALAATDVKGQVTEFRRVAGL